MSDMKILNLYAGIGGNRKLWGDEHEITAVEYKPEIAAIYKDLYPNDTVLVEDAHEFLLEHFMEYDFIWSSPPCQTHSKARFSAGVGSGQVKPKYPDMKLYQEILLLSSESKVGRWAGRYCIENVIGYYTPLITPRSFARHYFWTNFFMPDFAYAEDTRGHSENMAGISLKKGIDLSGYKHPDKHLLLRNCTEPELGKHILDWACQKYEPQQTLI